MKLTRIISLCIIASSTLLLTSCDKDDPIVTPDPVVTKPNIEFLGLTSGNTLVKYNANAAQTGLGTVTITGLQASELVVAIDFRPATGQLYGITNQNRIYFINPTTGVAGTPTLTAFTPAVSGTVVGFDFNPTVDRIRVLTSSGQNFRLNPETGGLAASDPNLNPGSPLVAGAAYTNNTSGATTTILYDINMTSKKLVKQEPANNGTLVDVGDLGVSPTAGAGFDISPDNSVAIAAFTTAGVNTLYGIDLATGKATSYGALGTAIIGIAIPTNPVAYAVSGTNLLIFNPSSPVTTVSKTLTLSPASAETIVGIDMRPATGQLYGLGSGGNIYAINMSTGAATAIGAAPLALSGTSFGFDFNPTVDRIRIVSNTGQNMRANPNDGTLAATDGVLNPGAPNVTGAAYTNSFAGATTTVLYVIDATTDKLYTQNPPNAGTLVEVAALGINVEVGNGFDIGGASGKAYGIFTVGTTQKLYSVNLTTGAATSITDFPSAVTGFAVGLGF